LKTGFVIVIAVLLLVAGCKKDVIPPTVNLPATPDTPQDTTPKWNQQFIGSYYGTWTETQFGPTSYTVTAQFDTTLVITAGVPDPAGMTPGAVDSTNTISFRGISPCITTLRFDATGHYYKYDQGWVRQATIVHDTLNYSGAYPVGMGGGHDHKFKGKKIQ
jgi:hypothetical protein